MKIQTYFDVLSPGRREYFQKDKFQRLINNLKPGRYIHTVEKVENNRSLEQNNTWWGICYNYFERALVEAGYIDGTGSNDYLKLETHRWCLHHFAPEDFVQRIREEWEKYEGISDIHGEIFKEPFRISSKQMNTKEGADYFNNMQNGYLEFFSIGENDKIPDPDPNKKRKVKHVK